MLYGQEQGLVLRDALPVCATLWENDQHVMKKFWESGYRKKELTILNHCRLTLQAITVGDLASSCGRVLSQWALKDESRPDYHPSTRLIQWPTSPPSLPKDHWVLWRQALTSCLCHPSSIRLKTPLSGPHAEAFRNCRWRWDPSEERIYDTAENPTRYFIRSRPGSGVPTTGVEDHTTNSASPARYQDQVIHTSP